MTRDKRENEGRQRKRISPVRMLRTAQREEGCTVRFPLGDLRNASIWKTLRNHASNVAVISESHIYLIKRFIFSPLQTHLKKMPCRASLGSARGPVDAHSGSRPISLDVKSCLSSYWLLNTVEALLSSRTNLTSRGWNGSFFWKISKHESRASLWGWGAQLLSA